MLSSITHFLKNKIRMSPFLSGLTCKITLTLLLSLISCFLLSPPHPADATQDVLLTWNPNSENDLAGYLVYSGTTSGIYGLPIDTGLNTSHTFSGLLEGLTYFFTVTAYDTSGNESVPSLEVSKFILPNGNNDTTSPTISLTAPAAGATLSKLVTLTATAADNIGVTGVQFSVNGSPLGSEDSFTPYSHTWDTSGLASGTYTLTAQARDAAGNTTTSTPISVTISSGSSGTLEITNLIDQSPNHTYQIPTNSSKMGWRWALKCFSTPQEFTPRFPHSFKESASLKLLKVTERKQALIPFFLLP
jgi:hypothetical protein